MEFTKYSVLMSLYINENPQHFKTAINSMIHQTIIPDEIVLVEDGPLSAELYTIINSIKNLYPNLITSVVNQTNMGLGIALRNGLLAARNELVARMDTDDIAVPNRCELQLQFLRENPDISVVGGQIEEFIGETSNIVGKREVPLSNQEIKLFTKRRCPFNHMTVMFKKQDVIEVGNYQDWHWNEDYYLWIRMALCNMKFANIPDMLVNVRVGEDMYKRRGGMTYFKSEAKLQKYMLDNKIIGIGTYLENVAKRFVVQNMLPNKIRGIVFRRFARKSEKRG